jgi:hypothetical protein
VNRSTENWTGVVNFVARNCYYEIGMKVVWIQLLPCMSTDSSYMATSAAASEIMCVKSEVKDGFLTWEGIGVGDQFLNSIASWQQEARGLMWMTDKRM